jgi:DUF2075 family protein
LIVYSASKKAFIQDVLRNQIENKIYDAYKEKIGGSGSSQINSWKMSMMYMSNILIQSEIPDDVNVAIEYQVPNTSKRVDFIVAGINEENEESVVIVELKQWSEAEKTNKDGVVKSFVGHALRELTHPSYQAWTYALLIKEYNETVRKDKIQLYPCAYLHNYPRKVHNDPIINDFYQEYMIQAPAFLRDDTEELSNFIKKYIRKADQKDILYRIDHGRIKPSKSLGEQIGSMLNGNKEFYMIEEQKIVYEALRDLAQTIDDGKKKTVIVKGGPGTGKSVIAINLLVELINKYQYNTQYVTRNSAPRSVYSALLKGYRKKSFIDNLFKGSGSYVDTDKDYFDCLIVDEAHRLNEKSGMFSNLGENQIKEIIHASKLSIFFIDEAQRVTFKDKGSIEEIKHWAKKNHSDVYEMELTSQFRCNGSDGYLAWIDNLLEIRETANDILDPNEFDFRVFDDPNELRDFIFEKNKINNKARLLAGYCWEWEKSKRNDTNHHDIQIKEHDFSMSWNLGSDGMEWLIKEDSVNEVGCIHTSQGLELDYIGVIIGDDLRYENGRIVTDVSKRAKTDQSVKGWKSGLKKNREETLKLADEVIKNTYRTLLTRGMKGCYVYCADDSLSKYFISKLIYK